MYHDATKHHGVRGSARWLANFTNLKYDFFTELRTFSRVACGNRGAGTEDGSDGTWLEEGGWSSISSR